MSSQELLDAPPPSTTPLPLPCTSRAATLPPELLAQIFDEAIEPWDSTIKANLAGVCRSWCRTIDMWNEYYITDSRAARRLATWLGQCGKSLLVERIYFSYYIRTVDDLASVGSLLRECRQLVRLSIWFTKSRDSRVSGSSVAELDLYKAVKGLRNMEEFEIGIDETLKSWSSDCYRNFLASWPNLRSIKIHNYGKNEWGSPSTHGPTGTLENIPTSLKTIVWTSNCDEPQDTVFRLLKSSRDSLQDVCLNRVKWDLLEDAEVRLTLKELAPRLRSLVLIDLSNVELHDNSQPIFSFTTMVPQMVNIEDLTLDIGCVAVDSSLFDQLATLPKLRTFQLYYVRSIPGVLESLSITSDSLINMLHNLPSQSRLEEIGINFHLVDLWSIADATAWDKAQEIARSKRVTMDFL